MRACVHADVRARNARAARDARKYGARSRRASPPSAVRVAFEFREIRTFDSGVSCKYSTYANLCVLFNGSSIGSS